MHDPIFPSAHYSQEGMVRLYIYGPSHSLYTDPLQWVFSNTQKSLAGGLKEWCSHHLSCAAVQQRCPSWESQGQLMTDTCFAPAAPSSRCAPGAITSWPCLWYLTSYLKQICPWHVLYCWVLHRSSTRLRSADTIYHMGFALCSEQGRWLLF